MGATAAFSVVTLMGASAQGESMRAMGDNQRRMAGVNADLQEMQAEDILKQGDKDVRAHNKKVKATIGSQRAALAASGVDVDDGTAAEIQADTAAVGAEDALTIRNNAWRAAWGVRVGATDTRNQGIMAELAADSNARNTLVTGGLQVAGAGLRAWGKSPTPAKEPKK